jgi:hypothetical protein
VSNSRASSRPSSRSSENRELDELPGASPFDRFVDFAVPSTVAGVDLLQVDAASFSRHG